MEIKNKKFLLLGARPNHDNRGVTALTEGVIRSLIEYYDGPEIFIQTFDNKKMIMSELPDANYSIRPVVIYSGKNIFQKCNIYNLYFNLFIYKLIPFSKIKELFLRINSQLKLLVEMDYVLDITGGDSFSDIYGIKRLWKGFLFKNLFIYSKKPLIYMPQTYGPFRSHLSKIIGRYLLSNASAVISRDKKGLEVINNMIRNHKKRPYTDYSPDVAFTLDQEEVDSDLVAYIKELREKNNTIIGLNISGLLIEQNAQNRFSLKSSYRDVIDRTIDYFLKENNAYILLVPHVITPSTCMDDDLEICIQYLDKYKDTGKVFMLNKNLSHRQMKYFIGMTDFFIGARMHSCIGAITQHVPTIGYAYSDKFYGVFQSAGLDDCTIDLRSNNQNEIIAQLDDRFYKKEILRDRLNRSVPETKKLALSLWSRLNKSRSLF
ncbi:MAG: polysaccharide pyruvyl transferase family protein [Candidatus Sedimenticola sp. (ex Thyasira tokunagai)]